MAPVVWPAVFFPPPSVASQANDVHIHSPPTSVGKEETFHTEKYRGGWWVERKIHEGNCISIWYIHMYINIYIYSIYIVCSLLLISTDILWAHIDEKINSFLSSLWGVDFVLMIHP